MLAYTAGTYITEIEVDVSVGVKDEETTGGVKFDEELIAPVEFLGTDTRELILEEITGVNAGAEDELIRADWLSIVEEDGVDGVLLMAETTFNVEPKLGFKLGLDIVVSSTIGVIFVWVILTAVGLPFWAGLALNGFKDVFMVAIGSMTVDGVEPRGTVLELSTELLEFTTVGLIVKLT